ncbi:MULTISPECIES: DUF2752 domain-containing protein [unclassified Streptomyces]|uniref:DUF2752 domain-containing protein n=1 Tax=unclassified Streptomyces TaxID=2593676 RepID=UPI0037FE0C3F
MDTQPTAGAATQDHLARPGEPGGTPARPGGDRRSDGTANGTPHAPARPGTDRPAPPEPGPAAGPGTGPAAGPGTGPTAGPGTGPEPGPPPAGPVPPPHPPAWPAGPVPPHAHAWSGPPPPRPLPRRLLGPLGTLAGVAAAFAYVGTVDPNEPGHYPVCPLLRFTGIYCPGCGGLRSAHAFVHGDLPAALGANALAVVGYGIFGVLLAVWLIRAVRGAPPRLAVAPVWWWATGAVLALFTLVRNLPFGSALAP